MGEYAYDFTGENAHDGACRNPHDPARMSGGSSSGCGSATAAGLAPVSLGSDTNGSIRVPASLCGIFGLKPTYGRLPRTGAFPFVDSLDHLGPFARSTADLALAYDAMQGPDAHDHACAAPARRSPACRCWAAASQGLRIGVAGGWFLEKSGAEAQAALARVADALRDTGRVGRVELPGAEAGRAAAYIITNSESAAFHLDRLRTRAADFDPDTRDRFLAGALLPAAWVVRAQRVRRWWLERMLEVFREVDLVLAPATPFSGAADRAKDPGDRRADPAAAPQSRPDVTAVLLRRPAGRHRAGLRARHPADRRAADRPALARGPLPRRLSPSRADRRRRGAPARPSLSKCGSERRDRLHFP